MTDGIFKNGVPYALDVKRLTERWPTNELNEGLVIPHEDLEAVLDFKSGSQRYYGVINSWMSQVRRETGIYMVWQPGDGVKVLNPSGVLSHAETRTRQKIKQTGRAMRIFSWVQRDRLDETGQQRLDHQVRVIQALKEATEKSARALAVELAPVQSLPKRKVS